MIRISQLVGAFLLVLGIVFLLDLRDSTNLFGKKITGHSIMPSAPGLQLIFGIALIVIGIFMSFPKLRELIDNK